MHRRINSFVEEIDKIIVQNYELTTKLNEMERKNLRLSQDINQINKTFALVGLSNLQLDHIVLGKEYNLLEVKYD